jgi:hypothetical protein
VIVNGVYFVEVELSSHLIQGNLLIDSFDNAQVGKIGQSGFYVERPEVGRFEVSHTGGPNFTLDAFQSIEGFEMKINGLLKR